MHVCVYRCVWMCLDVCVQSCMQQARMFIRSISLTLSHTLSHTHSHSHSLSHTHNPNNPNNPNKGSYPALKLNSHSQGVGRPGQLRGLRGAQVFHLLEQWTMRGKVEEVGTRVVVGCTRNLAWALR
jgi:hypothetical protein